MALEPVLFQSGLKRVAFPSNLIFELSRLNYRNFIMLIS